MLKVQMNMKSVVLCQSNVSLDLQSTLLLLVLVSAKITVDLGLDRKGFGDQGWWQRKLIGHEFDFYIELWQCLLFLCSVPTCGDSLFIKKNLCIRLDPSICQILFGELLLFLWFFKLEHQVQSSDKTELAI